MKPLSSVSPVPLVRQIYESDVIKLNGLWNIKRNKKLRKKEEVKLGFQIFVSQIMWH